MRNTLRMYSFTVSYQLFQSVQITGFNNQKMGNSWRESKLDHYSEPAPCHFAMVLKLGKDVFDGQGWENLTENPKRDFRPDQLPWRK